MDVAMEAVEDGFRHLATGDAANSPRSRLGLPGGALNVMAATAPGLGVMGLKTYGVISGGQARFYVQLFSTTTGELLAIIEASEMGRIRTGAATGVATRHLAREDASTVGIIGAGYQAASQLEAVCRARDVASVKAYSRTPLRRAKFAAEMSAKLGVDVMAVESAEACVRETDIVITITSSSSPVLSGEWLSPGTHVNAAGSNHRERRELDDEAVRRTDVIVADDIEQARIECGDLIHPAAGGLARWGQVRSLSDVIVGKVKGRSNAEDITLFESQGIALEDIAVGARVYDMAREVGVGRELPI